jgi:hypothetical protein
MFPLRGQFGTGDFFRTDSRKGVETRPVGGLIRSCSFDTMETVNGISIRK